jgi:hypothetical protein
VRSALSVERRRVRSVTRAVAAGAVLSSLALAVAEAVAGPPRRTIDMSRAFDSGAVSSPADIVLTPTPPDPTPMAEKSQWVFDLRWDRGEVSLLGVRELTRAIAQLTPRVMGRFALELFEGPTLIERVRFDFPLLGAPDPDAAVSITRKLRTRAGIAFPNTERGTHLELLDRATGRRWSLPWPPSAPAAPAPRTGPVDGGPLGRPEDGGR